MQASINLGRIWGIPIGLNVSWFLIFGLVTWSLATGYFPQEYPQLNSLAHWSLGFVTSILFFLSVLAHELGHAWVALRNKLPVRGITLFIFGGVAQLGDEPRSPGAEFRIAIAGPLVSLALAIFFQGLWLLDRQIALLAAPSLYLARINWLLALFNMIPGFPLDGGRVLRAIVWRLTGSYQRATRIASTGGQLVAFGFIGLGIFSMFNGGLMNGLWLIFIGWFLQNAASGALAQAQLLDKLQGVKVSHVMARDCTPVSNLTPLSQLVNDRVIQGGQRCFMVVDEFNNLGLVTLREIAAIPQRKWPFTTVSQVSVPLARLAHITPDEDLLTALKQMEIENVQQVAVVQDEQPVGMLSRDQIFKYLRTRAELGV